MGIASVSWVVGSFEPIQGHVERRVVGELARGCVESEPVRTGGAPYNGMTTLTAGFPSACRLPAVE
jgi:hypothetical protein